MAKKARKARKNENPPPFRHLLKTTESIRIRNFAHADTLYPIVENYSNYFEYAINDVFQRIAPPNCSESSIR